jgi:hypothetical protein
MVRKGSSARDSEFIKVTELCEVQLSDLKWGKHAGLCEVDSYVTALAALQATLESEARRISTPTT